MRLYVAKRIKHDPIFSFWKFILQQNPSNVKARTWWMALRHLQKKCASVSNYLSLQPKNETHLNKNGVFFQDFLGSFLGGMDAFPPHYGRNC